MKNPQQIIDLLKLEPLEPEGGYFRQTFKSPFQSSIYWQPGAQPEERALMTCIYYLITDSNFSSLHRVRGTEIFHFYAGDPVVLSVLAPEGKCTTYTLGPDLLLGQTPQVIVPPGHWQALQAVPGGESGFSLMGATVAPGFEFCDFKIAQKEALLREFPQQRELIERCCR